MLNLPSLGALPRLFVADLGHFEPRHGEANQVRVVDDVSFVVTVGMGSWLVLKYGHEQFDTDFAESAFAESAFDSDRHHMCGTEKKSMAGGIRYRQEECEQALLDSGYSIVEG